MTDERKCVNCGATGTAYRNGHELCAPCAELVDEADRQRTALQREVRYLQDQAAFRRDYPNLPTPKTPGDPRP